MKNDDNFTLHADISINTDEHSVPEKLRNALSAFAYYEEELRNHLSGYPSAVFEELVDCHNDIVQVILQESFLAGFQTGSKLAGEFPPPVNN